jgi:natural product precursor
MIEISGLKLTKLDKVELKKKQMNALLGGAKICGCVCACLPPSCGCLYSGPKEGPDDSYYGGSSTYENGYANQEQALDNNTDDPLDSATNS